MYVCIYNIIYIYMTVYDYILYILYMCVIIHDYILYICIFDYIHPSFTKLFVDDPRYSQVDQVKLSA